MWDRGNQLPQSGHEYLRSRTELPQTGSLGTKRSPLQADRFQTVPLWAGRLEKGTPSSGLVKTPKLVRRLGGGPQAPYASWLGQGGLDEGRGRVWLECQLVPSMALLVIHTFLLSLFPTNLLIFTPFASIPLGFLSDVFYVHNFSTLAPNGFPAVELWNILNFSNFYSSGIYTFESLNNCACLRRVQTLMLGNYLRFGIMASLSKYLSRRFSINVLDWLFVC